MTSGNGGGRGRRCALDAIEHQTAVLVRHFELLNRRSEIRDTLDRAEYLALRTLSSCGPMDINTLAAALGVDPSTAGRQVAVMRNEGLAACAPDPADRRRSVVSPTPLGLERMETVRLRRGEDIADLLADWTEEELRTLGTVFGRYNRAVAARHLTAATPEEPSDGEEAAGSGADACGVVAGAGADAPAAGAGSRADASGAVANSGAPGAVPDSRVEQARPAGRRSVPRG